MCPNEGGAFKQTLHGEWVHLLCAIWIPETRVANEVFMEPITGVNKISKQRWKLVRRFFKFCFFFCNRINFFWYRNAVSVTSGQGRVYNVLKVRASSHFMLHALGKRNYYCP